MWAGDQKPTLSFELFPPRSPKAAENLEKAIDYAVKDIFNLDEKIRSLLES